MGNPRSRPRRRLELSGDTIRRPGRNASCRPFTDDVSALTGRMDTACTTADDAVMLHYICTCPFAQVQFFLPFSKSNNNGPPVGGMSSLYFNSSPPAFAISIPISSFSFFAQPPYFHRFFATSPSFSLLFPVLRPSAKLCQNTQRCISFFLAFPLTPCVPSTSPLVVLPVSVFSSFRRKIPQPFLTFRPPLSHSPHRHFFFLTIFHFAMAIFSFMIYNVCRFERK